MGIKISSKSYILLEEKALSGVKKVANRVAADMEKVLKMCLIHDLGEVFTGDIPSFDKTNANEDTEKKLLTSLTASLFPSAR